MDDLQAAVGLWARVGDGRGGGPARGGDVRDADGHALGKSKSRRLFFYYQPRESPENWASGAGGPGEEDQGPGAGPRELFASDGLGARLRGRCVWFMRKEIQGDYSPVALDQTNDGAVTFGVLDDGVLDSVESVLYACYAPSLGEKKAWGKADPVYAKKFVGRVDDFVRGMQSSLKSLTTGLELRKPDPAYGGDGDGGSAAFVGLSSNEDWDRVGHYVDLLDEWCLQTESYLEEGAHRQWESPDAGPHTEHEYWRRRMQRLTVHHGAAQDQGVQDVSSASCPR